MHKCDTTQHMNLPSQDASLSVVIIGAGAFGCALAAGFSQKHKISIYQREEVSKDCLTELIKKFPEIKVIREMPKQADIIFIAVPTQALREASTTLSKSLTSDCPIVACCKGLERSTTLTPLQVLKETLPKHITGFLAGPNFAKEMLAGKPTCTNLAFDNLKLAIRWASILSSDTFTLIPTQDPESLQLLGAAKNVYAVGCGMIEGAGLGLNARASYLSIACIEMKLLLALLEQSEATLWTVGGIGDLILTCTSSLSRNYTFGMEIGKTGNTDVEPRELAEGAWTADAFKDKTDRMVIRLPALTMVSDILSGDIKVTEAVEKLFQGYKS